jgi:hypothetical protein
MKLSVRGITHSIADTSRDFSQSIANSTRYFTRSILTRGEREDEDEDDVSNYSVTTESRSSRIRWVFAKSSVSKGAALLGAALVAAYALATQFTGAPNYDATYDGVMPPKGAYGPDTIRKDRNDIGVSGYGSKIVAVAAAAIEDPIWSKEIPALMQTSINLISLWRFLSKRQKVKKAI